jgi:cell division septum initiation protein DivIVA
MSDTIETLQADISDITRNVTDLQCELDTAESCESDADFVAALEEALRNAESVKKQIAKMLKAAK